MRLLVRKDTFFFKFKWTLAPSIRLFLRRAFSFFITFCIFWNTQAWFCQISCPPPKVVSVPSGAVIVWLPNPLFQVRWGPCLCSDGAGGGLFWAVQWCWWCWSGSLCTAGAGLFTFLVPTLAWRSCKMVQLDDGLLQPANMWLKMVQISKLLQNYNKKGEIFVENKVWETHCSEALTVSSVNVYFKSPDIPHLISTSQGTSQGTTQGTSQGMSLYCYRGSL